jgi:hypothetical protein
LPDPPKNLENSSSDQDSGEESGSFGRLEEDDRDWEDEKAADVMINKDAVKAQCDSIRIITKSVSVRIDFSL